MRKIIGFIAVVISIALLGAPVHAGTSTITFDEFSTGAIDDLYGPCGVHFAAPAGAPSDDAEITAGGTWGITGNNGPQFLGCDGIVGDYGKSSGFVFELDDMGLTGFSFDVTCGAGTTTVNSLTVMPMNNGVPKFSCIQEVPLPAVNEWVSVDLSTCLPIDAVVVYVATDDTTDAYLGFDNVVLTGDVLCPDCESVAADFSADPNSGNAPLTVAFTDGSTDATSWAWDFGDGATSSDQNPTHTYYDAGTFSACLTAANECSSETVCMDITVDPPVCDPPTACFTADPASGEAPLDVAFSDCSEDGVSWMWDFGDGSTSGDRNPNHTYAVDGTYQVCLTVTNDCGATDMLCLGIVIDPMPEPPVAAFSAAPTSGCAALTVLFTDESSGGPTGWTWDFGDGTSSSEQHPTHTYSDPGTYTVTLNVVNDHGYDDEAQVDYITVDECHGPAVHVGKLYVWKQVWYGWKPYCRGRAWVQVIDESGKAVADAVVTAEWSDAVDETVTFTTNFNGWGMCSSDWISGTSEGPIKCIESFTLCVSDVEKDGFTYDPGANAETCKETE